MVSGTLVSAWFLFYTDFFPAIGGLLTLSGAFAWIALLLHLIREERKEEFRKAFERSILLRRWLWGGVAALALGFFLITYATGTVVIHSYRDEAYRSIVISRVTADGQSPPIRETALPARTSRKFLLAGRGPFRIKLSGLPALTMRARPFRPKVFAAPDDFTRPVVLLRPTLQLSQAAAKALEDGNAFRLVVQKGDEVIVEPWPFYGRVIWIGCDRDVAIPERIRSGWKQEEAIEWLPAMAPEAEVLLEPADELWIRIETATGALYNEARHLVEPANDLQTWVQEVEVDIPR